MQLNMNDMFNIRVMDETEGQLLFTIVCIHMHNQVEAGGVSSLPSMLSMLSMSTNGMTASISEPSGSRFRDVISTSLSSTATVKTG